MKASALEDTFDDARAVGQRHEAIDIMAPRGTRAERTPAGEAGQLLGYVGSTGNASASAPHLHFAIARLDTDRAWWKGDPINPYPLLAK